MTQRDPSVGVPTDDLTETGTVSYEVTGMTCAACEQKVTRALSALPGVLRAKVSARHGRATLTVTRAPSRADVSRALESAGYSLGHTPWVSPDPRVWATVGVATLGVAAAVVLALSLGLADLPSRLTDASSAGLVLVLLIGLTAGVSTCMALVGGLVLAVSASHAAALARAGGPEPGFATRMHPHVMFNVGRVLGFGVLGALLGVLGGAVTLPTGAMGLLLVLVAVIMGLLGLRLTGLFPRLAAWNLALPAGLGRALGIGEAAAGSYSDVRAMLLGAATFFLPCGFTQAVQVYALSTASPVTAGLIMATFALGTTPGLLALAGVPEVATGRGRATLLRVVGVVVMAFALINAVGGLRLLGYNIGAGSPDAPAATTAATASGSNPSQVTPAAPAAAVSPNVTVANGIQTVSMTQQAGYVPADTIVYAGLPITWDITSLSQYDCSAFLTVPSLGVQVNLTEGTNLVDLPALPEGVTSFTCTMGMYSGQFIAVPPPAAGT